MQTEIKALEACNDWLLTKMRGTIGQIDSDEARFSEDQGEQIDIVWTAKTVVGDGIVVCSTDADGIRVLGALVDGIQVGP